MQAQQQRPILVKHSQPSPVIPTTKIQDIKPSTPPTMREEKQETLCIVTPTQSNVAVHENTTTTESKIISTDQPATPTTTTILQSDMPFRLPSNSFTRTTPTVVVNSIGFSSTTIGTRRPTNNPPKLVTTLIPPNNATIAPTSTFATPLPHLAQEEEEEQQQQLPPIPPVPLEFTAGLPEPPLFLEEEEKNKKKEEEQQEDIRSLPLPPPDLPPDNELIDESPYLEPSGIPLVMVVEDQREEQREAEEEHEHNSEESEIAVIENLASSFMNKMEAFDSSGLSLVEDVDNFTEMELVDQFDELEDFLTDLAGELGVYSL
jgi:hypothetical protein